MSSILLAINQISSTMLRSSEDSFDGDLSRSMSVISEVAKVDRVYIWKNHTKISNLCASQIYEWSGSVEPQQDKSLVKDIPYQSGMVGWAESLSKGECVSGLVDEFSANTQVILSAQDIVSVLVAPIFLHKQFWGFIGIDDCRKERVFSEQDEILLRFSSELIAKNIMHNELVNTYHAALTKRLVASDKLSGQEIRLAELIVQGFSNPEIAQILNITGNTVKHYRKSLYSKLQIHSRRELFELLNVQTH
jgi:DNA-binding CsgD family transcriptional regulator